MKRAGLLYQGRNKLDITGLKAIFGCADDHGLQGIYGHGGENSHDRALDHNGCHGGQATAHLGGIRYSLNVGFVWDLDAQPLKQKFHQAGIRAILRAGTPQTHIHPLYGFQFLQSIAAQSL
jgi:hypothetical protein